MIGGQVQDGRFTGGFGTGRFANVGVTKSSYVLRVNYNPAIHGEPQTALKLWDEHFGVALTTIEKEWPVVNNLRAQTWSAYLQRKPPKQTEASYASKVYDEVWGEVLVAIRYQQPSMFRIASAMLLLDWQNARVERDAATLKRVKGLMKKHEWAYLGSRARVCEEGWQIAHLKSQSQGHPPFIHQMVQEWVLRHPRRRQCFSLMQQRAAAGATFSIGKRHKTEKADAEKADAEPKPKKRLLTLGTAVAEPPLNITEIEAADKLQTERSSAAASSSGGPSANSSQANTRKILKDLFSKDAIAASTKKGMDVASAVPVKHNESD